MSKLFGAIDLGASSGRVIAGRLGEGIFELTEIHRFANMPIADGNQLFWDFARLKSEIATGLKKLAEFAEANHTAVTSIGVDTWAVDYGLLAADGELIANPRNYRDERNHLGVAQVEKLIDGRSLFERNGLQFLPFNTLYQLSVNKAQDPADWERAETLLLIPDLINQWLTGVAVTERTNASTTGLVNVESQEWDWELIDELGFKRQLFTEIVDSGTVIGPLLEEHKTHAALANTVVTVVPSHDTAAAVVGTPMANANCAYLSSGTWSLLGFELQNPIVSNAARIQNFTNELGANNRIRFLKNLSGLWLLQQCLAEWTSEDESTNLTELLVAAAQISSAARVNVNDDSFLTPGEMPAKIQAFCARAGVGIPSSKPAIVRCILDSLADAYASAIQALQQITGIKVAQLNVVGGGSQNQLLSQLTADVAGIPVLAGPVEATAIGNLISQAAAHACAPSTLEQQRELINQIFAPITYLPTKL